MAIHIHDYYHLMQDAAVSMTRSHNNWTSFLRTASHLYPYRFPDQLSIHAQRPDATACTSYDKWNQQYQRYVKRGSKGIALLDDSQARPRLRYVFDVSDTESGQQLPVPQPWQVAESQQAALAQALGERYLLPANGNLMSTIEALAAQQAADYWDNFRFDILGIVDGSQLEEYDELNIGLIFCEAAQASITYTLMNRCGLDPDHYMDSQDFRAVYQFDSPDAITALGTAVSQINRDVLRDIERHIRQAERDLPAERIKDARDELHPGRRLPGSQHQPAGGEPGSAGQVRTDAADLLAGEPGNPVQQDAHERHAAPTPNRGGADSAGAAPDPDTAGDQQREADRTTESPRPPALDGPDEQPQSPGRGNHPKGDPLQLNLFASQQEQITWIEQAERDTPSPFAFSFAQEEIDAFLRSGSNERNSSLRITALFEEGKSIEDIAAFMQKEFRGGKGLNFPRGLVSAWFAEDGIRLAQGTASRYLRSSHIIPWDEAAQRIGLLLEAGQYLTAAELSLTHTLERAELAQAVCFLFQDMTQRASPSAKRFMRQGFPAVTERMQAVLADEAQRQTLIQSLETFHAAYEQDPSLLRFHFHQPAQLIARIKDLNLQRKTFAAPEQLPALPPAFITQDEVDALLTGGSSMAGGKGRILQFFQQDSTIEEKGTFLKKEYGIGGRSHALSGAQGSHEDHDGKGIRLQKEGCPPIQLTWTAVARRIDELIRTERYVDVGDLPSQDAEEVIGPTSPTHPENIQDATNEQALTELAKDLINDFCQCEYDSEADFSDLSQIGIAHTTITDDEISIQVTVDLVSHRLKRYLDDEHLETRQYGSLQELIENELETLDFSDLVYVSDEEIERYRFREPEAPAADTVAALPFPYAVGDAIYLEDNKLFILEEISPRNITLRDPSLLYPILRAESPERFAALLERFPQPAAEPVQAPIEPAPDNHRITDMRLGEGGLKAKYKANVDAIRLLLTLESDNRHATPEEQEVLSRYVGWGALANAFDEHQPQWEREY